MPKQLVFIDDSGDPGFKIGKNGGGSGKIFAIACIVFDNTYDANNADEGIRELKKELGWRKDFEFKYHRTNDKEKEYFFNNLHNYNFRVWSTVVNKTQIKEPKLIKSDSFYQEIIIKTLDRINTIADVEIYLDGKGGKNYRHRAEAKIRQALRSNNIKIRKFKFVDSKKNNLIQLADMIVGAIRANNNPEKRPRKNWLEFLETIEIYRYKK